MHFRRGIGRDCLPNTSSVASVSFLARWPLQVQEESNWHMPIRNSVNYSSISVRWLFEQHTCHYICNSRTPKTGKGAFTSVMATYIFNGVQPATNETSKYLNMSVYVNVTLIYISLGYINKIYFQQNILKSFHPNCKKDLEYMKLLGHLLITVVPLVVLCRYENMSCCCGSRTTIVAFSWLYRAVDVLTRDCNNHRGEIDIEGAL